MKTYQVLLFITAGLVALTPLNALALPEVCFLLTKSLAMGLALYSAYAHWHESRLTAAGMFFLALFIAPWNPFLFDAAATHYISLMVGATFIRLAINLRPTVDKKE
ncbi:hypothetical protein [Spirosoma sp. KUDC1026]|uniref:hypothetical protein n=1 Tax=Spirosoma sp. KUDC1026 TaxID=2745947 RepID=UPI00159BB3D4|nr:hypothetical protein [Spirosoma sp. KUDC1026]QKZ13144.1 hypothetical protein HU175_11070 [Spirosoma sp. KUDC1026]